MPFATTYKTDCCNILGGIAHIGLYRTPYFNAGYPVYPIENRDLGEVSKATINTEIETKERTSHRSTAGGLACSFSQIKKATLDLTVDCTSVDNRALANLGLLKEVASAVVVAEPAIVVRNAAGAGRTLVNLQYLIDETVTPVVKNLAGSTTYVAGTDYIIENGHLYVLDTGSIPVLTVFTTANITVDYTRRKQLQIEAALNNSSIYTITFAGFSQGSGTVSNHQAGVRYAKLQPANSDLITDDFANFELKFDLLADPALVGNQLYSPYYWGFFAAR